MLKVNGQFCQEHFPPAPAIPSTHTMIVHFISLPFLNNYPPSTIASYVSAISYVHKLHFGADPTDVFVIRKMIKGAHNFKSSCDTRLTITKEILSKLMLAIPSVIYSYFNQAMLNAMMSLAFYCFLRIGQMVVKSKNDISRVLQFSDINMGYKNKVPINMTVTIKNYKHSNLQPKSISVDRNANNVLCPVTAMLNYLKVVKHQSGPLFQLPVSYSYFSSSLKSLLEFIGLNPEACKFQNRCCSKCCIKRYIFSGNPTYG